MARRYYDINPTKLFKDLERRNYSEILLSFNNSKNYKICCDEASTWVVRSINGRVSWRMLPIHAAVATDAPTEVLEVLISACKTSLMCQDDRKQLPLHIAYRRNKRDVIELLVQHESNALNVLDNKGRLPSECVPVLKDDKFEQNEKL